MTSLTQRGLTLQGLAAALLLFGGPAMIGSGMASYNGGPRYTTVAEGVFSLNLVLVIGALAVQLYATHWGVITVVVPWALVMLAPEGDAAGKSGVCFVLLCGFVYAWRDWDRAAARVVGALQVLLVLVAAHPPLIAHGPADYYQLVVHGLERLGPLGIWLKQDVVDARPGRIFHVVWLATVGLSILSPALLQLDVLVDVLRRKRDRLLEEE